MLFNSYSFIFVFLPIALAIFFILGRYGLKKAALASVSISSLVFYSYWDIRYLPLLLFSISFNFLMGKRIENNRTRGAITFAIAGDLALLGFFKYTNFFVDSVNGAFGGAIHVPEIILPLGISFFTFTQIAYLVDTYRGETKGYSFIEYSLFVSIFPHLIAGPILYHKSIVPQFSEERIFRFSSESFARGLCLFSMGLFKKVIIADNLAPLAAFAFNNPEQATFIDAWQGALAYTLQLYFDFSAYSEMAVALGLMMNIHLPVNFNSPYRSKSIIEFWRRWHITLSDFLKYYLYIPLGGNRHGQFNKMRNLFLTMLLGGLWHGAGWTFVFWGALHGFYLVVNHTWRKYQFKFPAFLSWALTFFCVLFAWVFFRADSMTSAIAMLKAMAGCNGILLPAELEKHVPGFIASSFKFGVLRYGINGIFLIGFVSALCLLPNPIHAMKRFKPNFVWAIITVFAFVSSMMCLSSISEFLYFQF